MRKKWRMPGMVPGNEMLSFMSKEKAISMNMRKRLRKIRLFGDFRRCQYCGYCGGGWPDRGECPVCGQLN